MNKKSPTKQPESEILIVDDDAVVRLLHKNQVQQENNSYSVILCENGKEAVDHLKANASEHTTYLVLLDLNMPIMDGWEFLEECQRNYGHLSLHIVVVTSSINNLDELKAVEYKQVIAFCNKPFIAKKWKNLKAIKELSAF